MLDMSDRFDYRMSFEIKDEFHRILWELKQTGYVRSKDLAYLKFWSKYYGLNKCQFKQVVFTNNPNPCKNKREREYSMRDLYRDECRRRATVM